MLTRLVFRNGLTCFACIGFGICLFLQSQKDYISSEIEKPGSGFEEELEGIELKKVGRDDEALVKFYIAIGKKLDAPALYREASILLRKYKMHDEEIRVLKAGIANVPKSNSKHWEDLNARLEKAESLAPASQRIKDDNTVRHSRAHAV